MRKKQIGDATIYLGDALEIAPQLNGIDAVVSDPPYGISAKTDNRDRSRRPLKGSVTTAHSFPKIIGDEHPFNPAPWLSYRHVILWGGNHYAYALPQSSKWLIWDKRRDTTPDDNADCELAWTNLKGVARIHRQLWRGICREGEENISRSGPKLHPSQKPVALMSFCLQQLPPVSGAILDPYMGSGSTGIACIRLGIPFIGIEIDQHYFELACKRISDACRQTDMFAPTVSHTR
jgi:site-specific DNA-methyltransferase (adenine-specific)